MMETPPSCIPAAAVTAAPWSLSAALGRGTDGQGVGGEGVPGRSGHGHGTSASATGLGIFKPALGICKLKAYY